MNNLDLQIVLDNFKVTATGNSVIQGLEEFSNKEGKEVVVSTLPASTLAEQGVTKYFAPKIEQGREFKTTEELIEANVLIMAYEIINVDTETESKTDKGSKFRVEELCMELYPTNFESVDKLKEVYKDDDNHEIYNKFIKMDLLGDRGGLIKVYLVDELEKLGYKVEQTEDKTVARKGTEEHTFKHLNN